MQSPGQKGIFFVAGGVARQIYSNADKPSLSALAKQPNLISLLPTAFAQLTVANPVFAPGALVKSKTTSDIFLVTDLTRMVHLPDLGAATALGITEAPRKVEAAAIAREPHRIAFFLHDLAGDFHVLWNRGREDSTLRFIREDEPLATRARLALVAATATVLRSGLAVMGVEPVEEMR